jgi:hypothetical protein
MKNTVWQLDQLGQVIKNKLTELYGRLNKEFGRLPLGLKDYTFLIFLGLFGLLAGQYFQLRQELDQALTDIETLAKRTGIKIYRPADLAIKQIGSIYVEIPKDWTNIIENHIAGDGSVEKHFIASSGEGFSLPYADEYAFVVGIESRGVQTDLETYLKNTHVSSDQQGVNTKYTKINDEMFSIRREEIGTEYFRKIDDTVVVVFVYDNGDRTTDDFEQKVVNSVGIVEQNTLFDYR